MPRFSCQGLIRLSLCFVFVQSMTLVASDWPGFRGPKVDGIAAAEGLFGQKEGFGLKVNWSVDIGSGYSGVAIADGRLVTIYKEGGQDVAAAFDVRSGQKLWHYAIAPYYVGHDGSHDGSIATPLIHNGRVFVLGARGQFVSLDLKDGKVLWQTHLAEDHKAPPPFYGFGSSPLVVDGVLVSLLGGENQAIAGFNPETGEKLWVLGDDAVSYQAPAPWRIGGKNAVLAATNNKLTAIDAKAGTLIWSHPHEGGGARGAGSLTPVSVGDNRVFLAYKDDGSIVYQLPPTEEGLTKVWDGRTIRNSYNVPVYHQGHLYAFSSRILMCVDATTGEMKWRSRQPGDGFITLVDGHLAILTKNGSFHIVAASSEGYSEKASIEVFDHLAWTNPSFADGRFYLRSLEFISSVSVTEKSERVVAADKPPRGSSFGALLARLEGAGNKQALVDEFMKSHAKLPVVDADGFVHFLYQGEAKDMAIAGDLFGARQERSMARVSDTNLFYHSQKIEKDARVSYLFIKDYGEMMPDPKNDARGQVYILGSDMEFSFGGEPLNMSVLTMPDWKSYVPMQPQSTLKRGTLENHKLTSTQLEKEHEIQVYLPNGYEKTGDLRYPLVLIHHGQHAMERGDLVATLDNLIGTRIEPVIAVFILEQVFQPNPAYTNMVGQELMPFLEKHYLLQAGASTRANVGIGMGTPFAISTTLAHPELFGKTSMNTVFLFDSGFPGVEAAAKALTDPGNQHVYIDWGVYDLRNPQEEWSLAAFSQRMAKVLKENGLKVETRTVPEGFGWASWRNRAGTALSALFPMGNL